MSHNIGLSIGNSGSLDVAYLDQIARFQDRYKFPWHSDHLSFAQVRGASGNDYNAGLAVPVPYDREMFQQAMCDLIASPDLCMALIESPEEVLGRYDLSDRDRRRLVEVVQQPGMLVNCSLYRANRLSPIYNLVPHTCFLLGNALLDEATEFWKGFRDPVAISRGGATVR